MVSSEKAALAIRKRIIDGPETLGSLAYRNSQDSKTRKHNGEIGTVWEGDGRLDAEVDEAFWELKEGELSEPIKTAQGWWLVRKKKQFLANEQPLYEQRAALMKAANIDDNRLQAWRNAVANSERYTYERRLPGLDYNPDEK
ncbi:MAG: peptidylprolyl isomerase [Planctomycetota bacterium]